MTYEMYTRFKKIKQVVGEHIKDILLSQMIFRDKLNDDILLGKIIIREPPKLIQTCTGFNCICWKRGIKDFCIEDSYKGCLKCYKNKCIRMTEGHEKECDQI
jgi:hypothetical protein